MVMRTSFEASHASSSILGPSIFLSLFLDTISPYSSLIVKDQIPRVYKTRGKIVVLYILT